MSDAPKRLWLLPFDGEQRCWCDDPDPGGDGNADDADEYVRADIVKAQVKQQAKILQVQFDAMREALRPFAAWADHLPSDGPDSRELAAHDSRLTYGDVRRAQNALKRLIK